MKRIAICTALLVGFVANSAGAVDPASLTGTYWYGLYMNGQKAGYSSSRVLVDDDGNVVIEDDASFKLNMVGMKQDMRIFTQRTYTPAGDLARIVSRVDDISGTNVFEAVIKGETLTLNAQMAGQSKRETLPRPNESLEDALKRIELVGSEPEIGDSVRFYMFEPMYRLEIEGRSEIVGIEERIFDGVETTVYQVKTELDLMKIESTSYVTESGVVLEDVIAGGIITMRLEPEEIAKDVQYSNDVIVSNAATVATPIDNPRERAALRLIVRGPLHRSHVINDGRQTLVVSGDYFEFEGRKLSLADFETAQLPIDDGEARRWLEPSMFVQSDNPKLVRKAREIVGDETDAFEVAARLSAWVYDNVRSTFSARLTNSLEVLENMEGDCTEHSMLYIGLARAAGLPAREVAGLIYVDGPQPGFYFHQWATVWVGKWIDVDPTFNQPIADATHIKLAEGDLFKQAQLLPIIGQINIEVVE